MGGIVQKPVHDPFENFQVFKKYTFNGVKLGVGATSQVHEVTRTGYDGTYAVKIIVKDEAEISGRSQKDLQQEVATMSRLKHLNICKFYEMFEDSDLMYWVFENCEGGSLFEKLEVEAVLEEPVAKPMAKDMFSAVTYLHQSGYVHRDLRPENWMLSDFSDDAKLKLTHFRLTVTHADSAYLTQPCGTLHYVAPEVLRGSYGRPSDVWTIGVLLFLMVYGSYPFDGDSSQVVLAKILGEEADWSNSCYALSADAKDILKRLLTKDPAQRISLTEAYKHRWLPRGSHHRGSSGHRPSILGSLFMHKNPAKSPSGEPNANEAHRLDAHKKVHEAHVNDHVAGPQLKVGLGQERRASALVTADLLKSASAHSALVAHMTALAEGDEEAYNSKDDDDSDDDSPENSPTSSPKALSPASSPRALPEKKGTIPSAWTAVCGST